MKDRTCTNCKWLVKYTSEHGVSWMCVCAAEEPSEEEDGLYLVTAIDPDCFDASLCINFMEKQGIK